MRSCFGRYYHVNAVFLCFICKRKEGRKSDRIHVVQASFPTGRVSHTVCSPLAWTPRRTSLMASAFIPSPPPATVYVVFTVLCWLASFGVVFGAHISFSWIVSIAVFVRERCPAASWSMLWEDRGCSIIRETRRQQACCEVLWIVAIAAAIYASVSMISTN